MIHVRVTRAALQHDQRRGVVRGLAVFHSFLFVSLLVYRPVVVVVTAGLKSLEPRPRGWDPSTIAGGRRLFSHVVHSTIRYADPLADSEISARRLQ